MEKEQAKAIEYLEHLYRKARRTSAFSPEISDAIAEILRSDEVRELDKEFMREISRATVLDHSGQPDEAIQELERQLDQLNDDLPWWHKDDITNIALYRSGAAIGGVVRDVGFEFQYPPVFGVLPTGRINGMVIAVPGSPCPLMVLDDGLLTFAERMATTVIQCLPVQKGPDGKTVLSIDEKGWRTKLSACPQVVDRFFKFVRDCVTRGFPDMTTIHFAEAEYAYYAARIMESMWHFVLGHEYGHIVKDHLKEPDLRESAIAGQPVDEIAVNWEQEHEADVAGLFISLQRCAKKGTNPLFAVMGAVLFLTGADIIYNSISVMRDGSVSVGVSDSHPGLQLRIDRLQRAVSRFLPDEAKAFTRILEVMSDICRHLWSRCLPRLVQLHGSGGRPASIWIS
jgi:hypothetical protein